MFFNEFFSRTCNSFLTIFFHEHVIYNQRNTWSKKCIVKITSFWNLFSRTFCFHEFFVVLFNNLIIRRFRFFSLNHFFFFRRRIFFKWWQRCFLLFLNSSNRDSFCLSQCLFFSNRLLNRCLFFSNRLFIIIINLNNMNFCSYRFFNSCRRLLLHFCRLFVRIFFMIWLVLIKNECDAFFVLI
jgi:hypothetical protein